jgi:hypothetical protein
MNVRPTGYIADDATTVVGQVSPAEALQVEPGHAKDRQPEGRAIEIATETPPWTTPPWDEQIQTPNIGIEDPSTASIPFFKYEPLPEQSKCIRLLRLFASSPNNPEVTGQIYAVNRRKTAQGYEFVDESTKSVAEYEAVSWTWGTSIRDCQLLIRTPQGLAKMAAHDSLVTALKCLRLRDRDRFLWVDAFCINMDNREDRADQIPLISTIFAQSREVIV